MRAMCLIVANPFDPLGSRKVQVLRRRARVQSLQPKGTAPRLAARLTDKDYKPAPKQPVAFQVYPILDDGGDPKSRSRARPTSPPAYEKAILTDDSGESVALPADLAPGSYRVLARASVGERQVTAEDVFIVSPERDELEHPEARPDVLEAVAKATGGRSLGAVTVLPADLAFLPPRVVRIDRRSDIEVWSRPHLLLLALAFLGAEWALRRRRGFL